MNDPAPPRSCVEFLDAIRAKHALPSDYAAAAFLGLQRATVSRYRNGKDAFSDEVCMKVADALELPPGYVLACMHAGRARGDEVRGVWEGMAKRLLAACVAGVLIGGGGTATEAAENFHADSVYYVKRRRSPAPA